MLDVTIGSATHVGMKRKENQDYHAYFPPEEGLANHKGLLLVLADGMGGHQGGQTASKMAVDQLMRTYYQDNDRHIADSLKRAFIKANAAVIAKGEKEPRLRGMGCTLTAVVLKNNRMYHAHVGDSRGYTIAGDRICQFTEDHSFVASLVKAGAIRPEEAKDHPESNIITRAIGIADDLEVDAPATGEKLHKGQFILLCCDGLWGLVSDEKILETVRDHKDPDAACKKLVDMANASGGHDNISVLIARIDSVGLLSSLTSKFTR